MSQQNIIKTVSNLIPIFEEDNKSQSKTVLKRKRTDKDTEVEKETDSTKKPRMTGKKKSSVVGKSKEPNKTDKKKDTDNDNKGQTETGNRNQADKQNDEIDKDGTESESDSDDGEGGRLNKIINKANKKAVKLAKTDMRDMIDNAVKTGMENVQGSLNEISEEVWKNRQDIDKLKNAVNDIKESLDVENIKDAVKAQLTTDKEQKDTTAHKLYLLSLVEKSSTNLIIHGMASENVEEDVKILLKKIGLPEGTSSRLKIINCYQLGKKVNDREPSIMVQLGSSFERSEILKCSRNLPKGIFFKKDIPNGYRVR